MAEQKILKLGNPNLRKEALEYPPDWLGSHSFEKLLLDMRETLRASGGIGLAAPQINILYRVVVIDIVNPNTRYGTIELSPFEVYINPKIYILEKETEGFWEGCLSMPGMMGYVERPKKIRIDYLNRKGEPKSKVAQGFLSTVFQHEFDHLDGILYVDRISDPKLFSFEDEYKEFHV